MSPTPPTSSSTSMATSHRPARRPIEFYPLTPCRVVDTRRLGLSTRTGAAVAGRRKQQRELPDPEQLRA